MRLEKYRIYKNRAFWILVRLDGYGIVCRSFNGALEAMKEEIYREAGLSAK